MLLKAGAAADARDNGGQIALMCTTAAFRLKGGGATMRLLQEAEASVLMANKRKHVADANANINSPTCSKSISKVQRPATDADVNSALIRNAWNGDQEAIYVPAAGKRGKG
jgi:hypothetical protein